MPSTEALSGLEAGDHLCFLYETDQEHRAVLMPFLEQGLERGEKVIYIVDTHTAETVLGYLTGAGLDVGAYLASGQLRVLTRDDTYARRGVFDPDDMTAFLRLETEKALAEGYRGLRVTGEMTWALRVLPGSERLIEYEAKLNGFLAGSKCMALCQYDRPRFDPLVLIDILSTHPIAAIGTAVCRSSRYVFPPVLLSELPAARLEHWVQALVEDERARETLRDSEEKHRALSDVMREGIVIHDKGVILEINNTLAGMLGYEPSELIGSSGLDLAPGEGRQTIEEHIAAGSLEPYGATLRRKDGSTFIAEIQGRTITYRGRQVRAGVVWDVTERKRAEGEIKLLAHAVKSIGECVSITDEENRILFVNEAFLRTYGYQGDELIGERIAMLRAPGTPSPAVAEVLSATIAGGWRGEIVNRRKDGSEFPILLSTSVIRDDQGRPVALIGVATDITERKRAEEEIQSLARFPSENPNPVLRIARDGTLLFSNQAGLSLLPQWQLQVGQAAPPVLREAAFQSLDNGSTQVLNLEQGERVYSFFVAPIVEAGYANLYGRDVTERKRAEEQLRGERERLRALASQLSVAEERERRRLAATLHDQVGQVLALSRLKLAELREEAGGAGLAGAVDEVKAIVGEALAATRSLTSEIAPPVLYRVGLEAAIEWYGERLREQSGFAAQCARRGTPRALGPDMLGFLFSAARELLHNVVKHAHTGGARVLLDWRGEVLVLTVEDDGAGFVPEASYGGAENHGCFGLFSISERACDLGGRLEVASAPGQGTRVRLLVPVVAPGLQGKST